MSGQVLWSSQKLSITHTEDLKPNTLGNCMKIVHGHSEKCNYSKIVVVNGNPSDLCRIVTEQGN